MQLMRLPDAARIDLLEFLGATPVGDAHLARMIDSLAETFDIDRRGLHAEAA